METERRISTGIDGLDEAIDYLRPGDTVVWQCEHISDYMYVRRNEIRDQRCPQGRPHRLHTLC